MDSFYVSLSVRLGSLCLNLPWKRVSLKSVQVFVCLNAGMCFKYLMNWRLGHSNPQYSHISELVPGSTPFRASFKLLKNLCT